jgi:hypothetical protein
MPARWTWVHPKRNCGSHGGWVTPALQVQSISVKELHDGRTSQQDAECAIAEDGRNCRLWQYKESSKEVSETVYM